MTSLNSYAFSRPCVGRIEHLFVLVLDVEYLLVHGLDVLKSLFSCPRFLPRLSFERVCLVMKSILDLALLCRPKNFPVHGLGPSFLFLLIGGFEQILNKSNMEVTDSHNIMYIT